MAFMSIASFDAKDKESWKLTDEEIADAPVIGTSKPLSKEILKLSKLLPRDKVYPEIERDETKTIQMEQAHSCSVSKKTKIGLDR
jgi:hypothetical protein